jgi:hypothetical protein
MTARDDDRDGLLGATWRIVLSVRDGLAVVRDGLPTVRDGLSVRMGLLYAPPSRPGLRLRGLPV